MAHTPSRRGGNGRRTRNEVQNPQEPIIAHETQEEAPSNQVEVPIMQEVAANVAMAIAPAPVAPVQSNPLKNQVPTFLNL